MLKWYYKSIKYNINSASVFCLCRTWLSSWVYRRVNNLKVVWIASGFICFDRQACTISDLRNDSLFLDYTSTGSVWQEKKQKVVILSLSKYKQLLLLAYNEKQHKRRRLSADKAGFSPPDKNRDRNDCYQKKSEVSELRSLAFMFFFCKNYFTISILRCSTSAFAWSSVIPKMAQVSSLVPKKQQINL